MGLTTVDRGFIDEQGRTYSSYFCNVLDVRDIWFIMEPSYVVNIPDGTQKDNEFLFLPAGYSWEAYGVVEGCSVTIDFKIGGTTYSNTRTVVHVEGSTLVLDLNLDGVNGYIQDLTTTDPSKADFDITPESFELYMNHVRSTETGTRYSLIDGEVNRYIANGIDGLTVGGPLIAFQQLGNASGGDIVFPRIERQADVNGRKRYYILIPGERNPGYVLPEEFDADNCLKPWYEMSAISSTNSPSIRITTISTFDIGNTGYIGESFNGYPINYFTGGLVAGVYTVANALWEIGGNNVETFDHTQATDFEVNVNGKFSATSKFGISFFRFPSESEYKNRPNSVAFNTSLCVEDNLPVGTSPNIVGLMNEAGAKVEIHNVEIFQFGTTAKIKGTIVPNAAYTSYLENNPDLPKMFYFQVKVEDYSLTGNDIRPGWLEVAKRDSLKNVPPLGAWNDAFGYTMTDHNDDTIFFVPGTVGGIPKLVPQSLITEDNINLNLKIRIPRPSVQQVNGQLFTGLTLSVVAWKFTGETFKLETFDAPFPTSNGQTITLNDDTSIVDWETPRGFKLPPSSNKNRIKVSRSPFEDNATGFGVQVDYGMLMRWEYWIQQVNAAIEFYPDQNKDWYHYQLAPGWGIMLMFEVNTTDGAYRNFVALKHDTYDSEPEVTSVINYYREDGTPITKPIIGEITIVEAVHTALYPWEAGTWGEITVEPFEGAPRWLTSTYLDNGNVSGNPFTAMTGLLKSELILAGPVATVRTKFDGSLIDITNGLSFTAEIKGKVRKGPDLLLMHNRTKTFTDLVKKPSFFVNDPRSIGECCEKRKVVGDVTDTDPYKNDVTGHWMPGETMEFFLYHEGGDTGYTIDAVPFVDQANMWFCQINWRDVLDHYGTGCYQLRCNVEYAGITEAMTIDSFQLYHFSPETCANETRIVSFFNREDVRNNIRFNGCNIVDSIRLPGQFGYIQPNMRIRNYTKTDYEQNPITRQDRETYELRVAPISWKFVKILRYHLRHENHCLISDYCFDNPNYELKDTPVIVSETPDIGYQETGSRKVPVVAKFEEKVINNISTHSNDNPIAGPVSVSFANSSFSTFTNTDGSFTVTFTGLHVEPDSTVETYVDGVLVASNTFPSLEPVTTITTNLNWQ